MKTKHWILILGGFFLLSLTAVLLPYFFEKEEYVAEISQDGVLLQRINLAAVTEDITIPVRTENGENIILVQRGRISMQSASCPDQLCVHQGGISDKAVPIVCLPNRVVIQIK